METLGQKKSRAPQSLGVKTFGGWTHGIKNSNTFPVNNGIIAQSASGFGGQIHIHNSNSVDSQNMPTGLKPHKHKEHRSALEKKHH